MARICIVTSGQIGSNPRTVKEADALSAAGHDVTVIATRVLDAVEPRDRAIMAEARWRLQRIDFRSGFARRIERIVQIAARRAYRWTGLAIFSDLGHSEMTRRLSAAARRIPADLYIAHYVAALPAAAAAARAHGAPFAFDAEDFHPGDLPDDARFDSARQGITAIEARLLPRATFVTAASNGIATAYRDSYDIPLPQTVLNVFPLANAPAPPGPVDPHIAAPSLYWFSQTIGPDRGLECAIAALALSETRPSLHLRGMVTDDYAAALRALAEAHGVADRLMLLPPANPAEMERLAAHHSLGLASEIGHTRNRRIALTNKQFTYLLAGLPVLMSDIPAHQAFVDGAKGAAFLYRTKDPASLAALIDDLLGDPLRLQAARLQAYHLGQKHYNWEAEQEKLTAIVANALANRRS